MDNFIWFYVFVAFNAALLLLLAMNVSRVRMRERIAHGDGGNIAMKAAIRAHGNGIEFVPIFGLVILALCMNQTPNNWVAGLVIAFSLGRVLHAIGMLTTAMQARRMGAGLTFSLMLAATVLLIVELI
jgi:hypothetical protein